MDWLVAIAQPDQVDSSLLPSANSRHVRILVNQEYHPLPSPTAAETVADPAGPTNIEEIGLILYTDYVHYFQIAGMILLVAMIGAIVLTFRAREGVKKQDPAEQVGRKREEGYELVDIKPGQGLS